MKILSEINLNKIYYYIIFLNKY